MTFRSRVIAAAVLAATIAVVVACSTSYLTTRSALLKSVDASLLATARVGGAGAGIGGGSGGGSGGAHRDGGSDIDRDRPFFPSAQLVLANGSTYPQITSTTSDESLIEAAKKGGTSFFRTVTMNGLTLRELIVPLKADTVQTCPDETCLVTVPSVAVYSADLDGQLAQLHDLATTLLLVGLSVMLLALLWGIFLARQALKPLEDVTNEIEDISHTTDLERRLDDGGGDELGRLRRVFNALLGNVQASQTLQRQLVMDASHELRTPLTSLRTNAQVLSQSSRLSAEDVKQITQDMVMQVDELAALVSDLGELSRGERSEGVIERLRLDECIDECLDTARTYARLKNITIETSIAGSEIEGRKDRLIRAISNFLTNAIKFTPENGVIRVVSANGAVSVSDSGPGIAEADRPFVFDRFWRSPSARALPGSGLGLSIVAQVVAEFGGDVAVDADPELGGARFTMTLPLA
jgi:two-component system sensor histidine kinase MprB